MAIAVGLDIGQDKVCAVALRGSGNTMTVERFARVTREQLGPSDDPMAFAMRLRGWLGGLNFPTSNLQLSVAGRDSIIRYSNLPPMPAWRLKLLMDYEIAEVAEKAGEALTSDYSIVPAQSMEKGYTVLVALVKDSAIEPIIEGLSEARVEVESGQPSAVAVGDALRVIGDPDAKGYTVIADIGKSSTDVAVLDGGVLVFARTITQGGDLFTDKIAKHYDCSFEDAERYKIAKEGPDGKGVGPVLRNSMTQFGNLIRSSLNYMKGQLKLRGQVRPAKLILTGGGARMPALARTVGEMLKCPGEVWDPVGGIDFSQAPAADQQDIEAHGMEAAVACGLAIKALSPNATKLMILPAKVQKKREWQHRTLWLIIAGVLLVTQSVFSFALNYHRSSKEAARAKTIKKVNQTAANTRQGSHNQRKEDNNKREKYLTALTSVTRSGRNVQEVLEILQRTMPGNMTITALRMEAVADNAGGDEDIPLNPAPTRVFKIDGEVDNAQLRCEQQLVQLEEVINQEPTVESARIVPTSNTENPRVKFSMVIKPKNSE